jgi:hypothetical protein
MCICDDINFFGEKSITSNSITKQICQSLLILNTNMEYSNMLITTWFLKSLIELYRKHFVYSDGDLWYHKALQEIYILRSQFEKGIIEG